MKTSATGAAAILAGRSVIFAASAKRKLKVALLGCGGRGNGALGNCIEAATNINGLELELVAPPTGSSKRPKRPAADTSCRHLNVSAAETPTKDCSKRTRTSC